MKKLFFLFAAATLFVGVQACKQKTEEAATEEVATEVVAEPATEVVADSSATVTTTATADTAAAK